MVFTIRNLFRKPLRPVLRERLGAFRMATTMTNSEALVTSAAPYTTESKQTYPQGMSEARHGAVLFLFSSRNIDERIGSEADRELTVCSSHFAMGTPPWG